MIKNDLANLLERKANFSRAKAALTVETILETMKRALLAGEKIEIRGFGSFRVMPKKTGFGRDIRRNRQIPISGGRRVKFRPGQDFKKQLKQQSIE